MGGKGNSQVIKNALEIVIDFLVKPTHHLPVPFLLFKLPKDKGGVVPLNEP
jgi:hypothetical protein